MKILLIGYYGKGNFGDDILLLVTYSIIRQRWPEASVSIQCDGDSHGYVSEFLGEKQVTIIAPGHRQTFDLGIYGGGGVFFDFSNGSFFDGLVNRVVLHAGGSVFTKLDTMIRRLIARPRVSFRALIGWGIGVGTYTRDSRKLRDHVPALVQFKGVMLRDDLSMHNVAAMGLIVPATVGSDIAFMGEYWVPGIKATKVRRGRRNLGIVLRDWAKGDNTYLESVRALMPELDARYEISFFFLDAHDDQMITKIAEGFSAHIWQPSKSSMIDFVNAFSSQDVLITSRAHGAICGAVLGVPSMLIEIEPKLQTVHNMLANSSLLVSPQFDPDEVLRGLDSLVAIEPEVIVEDVARNRAMARAAVNRLIRLTEGCGQ